MVTKQQFLADVLHEINALKANATSEEIANLDFDTFNPIRVKNCIYGQMTGACNNKRAQELMNASCIRVMDFKKDFNLSLKPTFSEEEILDNVNGENTGQTWGTDYGSFIYREFKYLSTLEAYILMEGAKHAEIIAYLKGEQETLTL